MGLKLYSAVTYFISIAFNETNIAGNDSVLMLTLGVNSTQRGSPCHILQRMFDALYRKLLAGAILSS